MRRRTARTLFTTVSEVTAWECEHLLQRKVDHVLPNALNIERFTALHEFQNLHRKYKENINRFVMGHFFSNYPFDLDKTLYFFTSGRYEFRNKGFDVTIEALARLNWRLQQENIDRTVVCFFITKRPFRSINAGVLHSRAVMEELRDTCEHIEHQIGDRLFVQTAMGRAPQLDDLVDEYWRLRLKRTAAAWRRNELPGILTHDLVDDTEDDLLNAIRKCNLVNNAHDKVKVIYHPDFISPGNPLFGMEYDQFVRGCHLGVFPSYYEPWGYTPLECVARGIPAITSDLSGFGAYVEKHYDNAEERGIYIAPRRFKLVRRHRELHGRSDVRVCREGTPRTHHAAQHRRGRRARLRLVQPRRALPQGARTRRDARQPLIAIESYRMSSHVAAAPMPAAPSAVSATRWR